MFTKDNGKNLHVFVGILVGILRAWVGLSKTRVNTVLSQSVYIKTDGFMYHLLCVFFSFAIFKLLEKLNHIQTQKRRSATLLYSLKLTHFRLVIIGQRAYKGK